MNEKKNGIGMHDSNHRPTAVVRSGDLTAAIREFEGAESESDCRFDVYRTNPETGEVSHWFSPRDINLTGQVQ